MINERRAILSLVAMGRITAAEAERLILAWQDARDWIWIAIVCAAALALQAHPSIHIDVFGSLAHAVVANGTKVLHTAASIGLKRLGGTV
jgi:hypothetical protein